MKLRAIGFERQNLDEIPLAAINPFRIIEEDGKIGVEHYFTPHRKIIIPAEYDYIERIGAHSDIFFIVGVNKKYGVYNSEGKLIIDVIYDRIYRGFYEFILVRKGKYRGAYDFEGNHIVPDKYKNISAHGDIIRVETYSKLFGAYDYQGNHIVPNKFLWIDLMSFSDESEEFIYVEKKAGNFGVYNKKGKEIVPAIYNKITLGKNFIIANTSNSNFTSTVYSYDGSVLLPTMEGHAYHDWNGIAIWYWASNGVVVCDEKGKEFEPGVRYKGIFSMHDEFFAVQLEGKWKVLLNK